jgi:hypothetical protein
LHRPNQTLVLNAPPQELFWLAAIFGLLSFQFEWNQTSSNPCLRLSGHSTVARGQPVSIGRFRSAEGMAMPSIAMRPQREDCRPVCDA